MKEGKKEFLRGHEKSLSLSLQVKKTACSRLCYQRGMISFVPHTQKKRQKERKGI